MSTRSVREAIVFAIAALIGTLLALGLLTAPARGQSGGGVIGEPVCYRALCLIHYLPEIHQ